MSRKRSSVVPLYEVLKNELKAHRLTYRDVARALGTSENSIKLRFSNRRLSLDQILAIADLLGTTVAELMRKTEEPSVRLLTPAQEVRLVQNMQLLLVLMRILDDWSIDDIVASYNLTHAECIKCLLELDRMRLIDLMPNNVVRKRIRRGIDWQPGGALHRFFESRVLDFLNSRFDGEFENRFLARASLTPVAIASLQADMRQLRTRLEILHEECKIAPASQRHDIFLFVAEREWEMSDFTQLRRKASDDVVETASHGK